jgi:hypothetical protein
LAKKQIKKIVTTYHDNQHPNPDFMNPYNLTGKDPNNDIWEGREPHHIIPETGYAEYKTWFGSARFSPEGKCVIANVSFNNKVTVYIVGNRLTIIDIRHDGDPRAYGYAAENGEVKSIWPAVIPLEDERIDKMLILKNIDCPIWEQICKRAREIWLEENDNRHILRKYIPEVNA